MELITGCCTKLKRSGDGRRPTKSTPLSESSRGTLPGDEVHNGTEQAKTLSLSDLPVETTPRVPPKRHKAELELGASASTNVAGASPEPYTISASSPARALPGGWSDESCGVR